MRFLLLLTLLLPTIQSPKPRLHWFKGNTHAHTLESDGDNSAEASASLLSTSLLLVAAVARGTAQQQSPTFRSSATIVPLDVRVLDRQGRPVTDLRQSDFTVLENGIEQPIAHFAAETLGPLEDLPPQLRRDRTASFETPKRRVILLVLGRGILEAPFNGITAAIDFVRTRLLPQDFVAVMAWNRATDFTTDHGQIAAVLERFRDGHQYIELRLQSRLGGLGALYGNRRIPASMQSEIDRIFDAPGLQTRSVHNDPAQMDPQVRQDIERDLDDASGVPARAFGQFLNWITPTLHDAGNIQAGIEYLRFIDGEKRLIFVTEDGFALPRTDSDLRIAEAASDARVAIDVVHTGGTTAEAHDRSGLTDEMFRRMSAIGTLRLLSENSGGQRYSTVRPAAAFERLDAATRSQYVMGYYPRDVSRNGQFRNIEVKVGRPDVTVHVRRGYYARELPPSFDRAAIMAETRMTTAAALGRRIPDIEITAQARTTRLRDGSALALSGRIAAKRLGWMKSEDGRYRVSLELVVAVLDGRGLLVGEHRQPLVITTSKDGYDKAQAAGLTYSLTIPLTGQPRDVTVIAYDAAMDLVGSEIIRLGR